MAVAEAVEELVMTAKETGSHSDATRRRGNQAVAGEAPGSTHRCEA